MDLKALHLFRLTSSSLTSIASTLAPTRGLWITQPFLIFSGRFQPSMFFWRARPIAN